MAGHARSGVTFRYLVAVLFCWLLLAQAQAAWAGASAGALEHRELSVNGVSRRYELHLPVPFPEGRPVPLVVILHGGGGSGGNAARQTGFAAEADRGGFIAVFPDGSGRPRPLLKLLGKDGLLTWNAGDCCGYAVEHGVDDVAFIRALVARLRADYPVDPRRIYATGLSNGGMMAYRLACEVSDLFAAVGPVAAVQLLPECRPRDPISVIHIHGTADENVPMAGGEGRRALVPGVRPPVAETIRFWAAQNGCSPMPSESQVGPHLRLERYGGCRRHTAVAYYQVEGGGHAWPGGDRISRLLDAPDPTVPATRLLWKFFAAHPKE